MEHDRPVAAPCARAGFCKGMLFRNMGWRFARSPGREEVCYLARIWWRVLRAKRDWPMPFTLAQFVTWLIVGLLGGSAAGIVVVRRRRGFGAATNLGLGIAGAIVGGLVFRIFSLFPNLDAVSISLRDVLAAFLGSLLVLAALWVWQRYGRRR